MFIGRLTGWVMVAIALLMASGEAVMALGTGNYRGLATSDLWALLWGQAPSVDQQALTSGSWALLIAIFMALPAWAVVGPIGIIMARVCRRRPPRGRLFRTS